MRLFPFSSRSGFSLVELSIVLVILGLLTGGILAGQSLIAAAQLRSVSTEFNLYNTAINSFRDKYFAIPGDMTNATAFWGTAAACPGAYNQVVVQPTTCNGDGNGIMSVTPSGTNVGNEEFRFWQQLAAAGLISGSYSGVRGVNWTNNSNIGFNVPASKFPNAGWSYTNATTSGSTSWFDNNYNNHFIFGAQTLTNALRTELPVIKPEDVWNLDKKLDDGMPATGKIMANIPCTDAANSTTFTANYLLTSTGLVCAVRLMTQ